MDGINKWRDGSSLIGFESAHDLEEWSPFSIIFEVLVLNVEQHKVSKNDHFTFQRFFSRRIISLQEGKYLESVVLLFKNKKSIRYDDIFRAYNDLKI